ncbi:uncharacterized protein TrAtP1_009075 [Trichoderma atroviride]|uniref:uncharacterized protein n=1 Tax=Hypocrea atroviridis TaxID=63577 RepID=UPI0033165E30|nr:hypothetical protein TrAtP1_009075 [Trichoderma atroviride]
MEAKPTYHLPPNFSTPPPPDGPFHLGTVLRDFEKKEQMRPLNQEDSQRIPIPKKHEDVKKGFTATRKRMKSGEFGLCAKFMGLNGVGGEASIAAERHDSDRYSFETFETKFFYPTPEYISDCFKLSDVDDYLQGSRYKKAVFLVTGLKIGKGVTVGMNKKTNMNGNLEGSVSNPGGVNAEAGIKLRGNLEHDSVFTFTESSDIVIGIQCVKIYHEKSGFLGLFGEKEIKSEYVTAGATFYGENSSNSPETHAKFVVVKPEDYDIPDLACYSEVIPSGK